LTATIRAKGLQIDAVLCLGNSLYAIFFGLVIVELVSFIGGNPPPIYPLTASLTHDSFVNTVGVLVGLLLCFYYTLDWYDLNRAPYIDEEVGGLQLLVWMVCILFTSLVLVLAVRGIPIWLMVISAIYVTLTVLLRDYAWGHLSLSDASTTRIYWKGTRDGLLFLVLLVLDASVLLVILMNWNVKPFDYNDVSVSQWMRSVSAGISLVLWFIAVMLKWRRSTTKIANEYASAIQKLLSPIPAPQGVVTRATVEKKD
jgi:hypothetical protein